MKLSEFKAWFSGYTEDMTRVPTSKQWKRIKEVVEDIDGQAVTEHVYLDRYWYNGWRPYYSYPVWNNDPTLTVTLCQSQGANAVADKNFKINNTADAMYLAGRSESLTANSTIGQAN